MHRLVHFEIHAEDPERAKNFYSSMFGWTYVQYESMEYWLVRTKASDGMAGMNGAITKRRGPAPEKGQPVNGFVCTIDIENIDTALAKAQELGATIALPKMVIPSVGWVAYIHDTEGNILGLLQPESNPS